MNTRQLQQHLASSLTDLARAASKNENTEDADELILRVLTNDDENEEEILKGIQEVSEARHKLMVIDGFEAEINLNQLYAGSDSDDDSLQIWQGLHQIASHISKEKGSNDHLLKFIYRALQTMNQSENERLLKEMDIVRKICRVS